jgi:hypothetical protein
MSRCNFPSTPSVSIPPIPFSPGLLELPTAPFVPSAPSVDLGIDGYEPLFPDPPSVRVPAGFGLPGAPELPTAPSMPTVNVPKFVVDLGISVKGTPRITISVSFRLPGPPELPSAPNIPGTPDCPLDN